MPTPFEYRIPLISADERERFILDVSRGSINLQKVKYQTRARNTIVILRLDLDRSPHRNPDGKRIIGPHIHIYKEGFGYQWAYLLTSPSFQTMFPNIGDEWQTFHDFLHYANITRPPNFERGIPKR